MIPERRKEECDRMDVGDSTPDPDRSNRSILLESILLKYRC